MLQPRGRLGTVGVTSVNLGLALRKPDRRWLGEGMDAGQETDTKMLLPPEPWVTAGPVLLAGAGCALTLLPPPFPSPSPPPLVPPPPPSPSHPPFFTNQAPAPRTACPWSPASLRKPQAFEGPCFSESSFPVPIKASLRDLPTSPLTSSRPESKRPFL